MTSPPLPGPVDTPPAQTVLVDVDTSSIPEPAPPPGPRTLRVLSWNVRDLLGEPLRVQRAIRAARPDVVCLQEGPRLLGSRMLLAGLARECGLYVAGGGRRSAGVAILASLRTEVLDRGAVPLPTHRRRLTRRPQTLTPRPRGVVRARVGLPGTVHVGIASIHLPTDSDLRDAHVPMVVTWPDGRPLDVLAGDVNDVPGSVAWTTLATGFADPGAGGTYPTFPAHAAHLRLDAILVHPELRVTRYGWPQGVVEEDVYKGSDHRPVCADLVLPPR